MSAGLGGRCGSCGRPAGGPSVAAATATPLPTRGHRLTGSSATGPLAIGEMFGDRYRILKTLGAGGMGVVYQAWDQTLEVAVALKVIRPDAVTDPEAARDLERRFKRELLLARQVTHRNVVRIHDFGEIGGIKYISMPFIEGRDLAAVLADAGRLPVREAIDVIRQVGSGLIVAHEVGVVHRDLKPENIMIDAEGRALIMDFGISRSVSSSASTVGLTVAGSVVGTLEYMAPEQARGEAADQRADVYAVSLMLYDMLVGRRRLERSTSPMVEMMGRLEEPPPRLRTIAPDLPEQLEAIVSRALDPDSAKRYQTVADLIGDLDAFERGPVPVTPDARGRHVPLWLAALVLVVGVTAGVAGWWLTRGGTPAPVERDPVTVLIADFHNRTGDEVFEGSVEQALSIGLEGASFVTAYPRRDALRSAALIQPNARLDDQVAPLVARREGIHIVLAGSIEPAGAGYRIGVRAIDPTSLDTLVSQEVQASDKAGVLAAVSALATRIRAALGDTPVESAEALQRETFTAGSLEAAREYSLGQELSNSNRDEEAVRHYARAIELDPNFGRAYSGMASVEARLGRTESAAEHFEQAIALADKMTEREKLRTLGAYYTQIKGDYETGIKTYSDLVSRFPGDGAAHNNLAVAYFNTRDFQKALEEGRRVIEVFPKSVLYRYNYALYAMYAGDFATAEREARVALELNPETPKAYLALAMAALASDRVADAKAAYEQARGAGPRGASLASIGLADIAMYEGRFDDAVKVLEAGIAADQANRNVAGRRAKQLALAEAQLALGRRPAAAASVAGALDGPLSSNLAVPAASSLIALGREAEALKLAKELSTRFSAHDQAAAQLIEARAGLARGRPAEAVATLRDAARRDDLWLVRFTLGSAYVQAGEAALALQELDQCERRIGEVTSTFLDDVPTFRYRVPLMYWTGRAQHALGQASAAQTLREFLAHRPEGSADPLAADARRLLEGR